MALRASLVALAALAALAASAEEECASPQDGGADERYIIAWPCDPGECHIYFGQQRKAFPTNFNLARATNRTLVLAPFPWYENQAQQYTNAFKKTASGARPYFTCFSDLFDLSVFNRPLPDGSRLRIIELHKFAEREMAAGRRALGIELAIVSKGIPGRATLDGRTDPETDASTVVVPYPCAEPLEGIALNLSAHGSGELWGLPREQVEVREMRCGYAMLARAWKQAASRPAQFGEMLESPGLFGGKRLVALLGTGHQPHSHAHDAAMQQVSQQLAYAAPLLREAERFIGERLAPLVHSAHEEGGHQSPALPAAGGGYVAVHWRHGDYVPYGHATEVQVLAGKVAEALARLDGCQACPVFLATNCKEQQPLNELRELLYPAPVLVYAPPDGPAGEAFRSEGHRLMVDQAIAARGSVFVRSPRSAVSTFIDVERKRLGLDSPAMSING